MKPKNILIVLGVALVISGMVLFFLKKKNDAKNTNLDQAINPVKGSDAGTVNAPVVQGYPIVYNVKSEAAKLLQIALGFNAEKTDGIVGPYTLKIWQYYHNGVTERFSIPTATALQNEISYINAQRLIKTY